MPMPSTAPSKSWIFSVAVAWKVENLIEDEPLLMTRMERSGMGSVLGF